jgi:hypothetical protein
VEHVEHVEQNCGACGPSYRSDRGIAKYDEIPWSMSSRTEVHEVILVFGHFGPWRSYLKMALKNDFFDFFQPLCFWKAETKLEMDLLDFLGSEVI